ncbi:hypothetical protein EYC84_008890 [Monilinia fructicola]|uniref:Uncharacterized protein n=1 Tax=Monilinia fructicola TaxID=38448 RepID=A0A5M9JAD6_MONFR|nr:hypothetical protein EYC84_008890 [Monilinia fructicola]
MTFLSGNTSHSNGTSRVAQDDRTPFAMLMDIIQYQEYCMYKIKIYYSTTTLSNRSNYRHRWPSCIKSLPI